MRSPAGKARLRIAMVFFQFDASAGGISACMLLTLVMRAVPLISRNWIGIPY